MEWFNFQNATANTLTLVSFLLGATIYFNLFYLSVFAFKFFAARQKQNHWGVVYNAMTKAPIENAIVRIINSADQKLIQTAITDKRGRFGFLVPPQNYQLKVIHPDFLFPSRFLKPETKADGIYENIYFGNSFNLNQTTDQVISLNVPLDPIAAGGQNVKIALPNNFSWQLKGFWRQFRRFLKAVAIPVYIIALLYGIITYIDTPNVASIIFYLIIASMLLKEIEDRLRKNYWGLVYNAQTRQAVSLAKVMIYDLEYNRIKEIRYSDGEGHFGFLVPKGQYYLKVEKNHFNFPSQQIKQKNDRGLKNIYFGAKIDLKADDAIMNLNVPLDPLG